MSQETVEIDPEELSESVREDLQNELDMDESFAKEKANQVHLDNIDTVEADSTKPLEIIYNYFNNSIEILNKKPREFLNKTTNIGVIKEIEPKYGDMIQLSIDVGDDTIDTLISKDSKKLAHITEYHNVEKLSDLKDKQIFYYVEKSRKKFIIPKDVNVLSNLRYKIYGIQRNIRKSIEHIFGKYDDLTFNSTVISIGISTMMLILFDLGLIFNILALLGLSYGLFMLTLGAFALISMRFDDYVEGENYEF